MIFENRRSNAVSIGVLKIVYFIKEFLNVLLLVIDFGFSG